MISHIIQKGDAWPDLKAFLLLSEELHKLIKLYELASNWLALSLKFIVIQMTFNIQFLQWECPLNLINHNEIQNHVWITPVKARESPTRTTRWTFRFLFLDKLRCWYWLQYKTRSCFIQHLMWGCKTKYLHSENCNTRPPKGFLINISWSWMSTAVAAQICHEGIGYGKPDQILLSCDRWSS